MEEGKASLCEVIDYRLELRHAHRQCVIEAI